MDERRAYAAAMASLAAPRRREAFGTANMACGEATLRRRVEALFRAEPALRWWQKALRRLLAFAMPACVLLVSLTLFSGPAHCAINEENLLNFVGHDILFELSEGMHPDSFPTLRGEDYIFRRLETKTPPYGAAAVYNDRNDIYLSFSDGHAAADDACAQLAARLDGFLGAREDAGRVLHRGRRPARYAGAASGRPRPTLGDPRHVARHCRPVRADPRLLARRGRGHGHHHPRPRGRRKWRGGRASVSAGRALSHHTQGGIP